MPYVGKASVDANSSPIQLDSGAKALRGSFVSSSRLPRAILPIEIGCVRREKGKWLSFKPALRINTDPLRDKI